MKKSIIFFLISSVLTFNSFSQEFEGEVTYKIAYKNLPEEMKMYKAMMPKKTKIIIKNEWSKIEQNMLVMKMDVITNSKTKKTIMLMKGMGKKIAVESKDTTNHNNTSYKVTKEKGVKIIEGYKCHKVTLNDSINGEITMWVTNELPSYKNSNLPDVDLDGFPMEFNLEKDGITMRMTASKIEKKKINDKEFEIPEGYEKKTAEEMGEMIQGMKF